VGTMKQREGRQRRKERKERIDEEKGNRRK
jgi:hypothetical protein